MPRFATVRFAVARSATGTLQMAAILLVVRTGRGVCGNSGRARDRALIRTNLELRNAVQVGDWLKNIRNSAWFFLFYGL
jgi:hypothetical protein